MFLAARPGKPTSAPVSDPSVTNGKMIKVDYAVISDDGGLPLLSYEL